MNRSGLSTARLARLRGVLTGYVERGEQPGVVALVCRRGERHVEAIGRQAIGGPPIRRDTIFRISSLSKPIAAAAALILVEESRLRLDEPVDRLLPELAERRVLKRLDGPLDETVPAERPITLRDLLTFRLGLGLVFGPPGMYPIADAMAELKLGQGAPSPATPPEPDEWLRRLATLPLMYQPGERWLYNTGSDLLGVLIARAAGQPLESFLRERLFAPLGMNDTGFSVPAEKIDRFTPCYRRDPQSGAFALYDPAAGGQWSVSPAFPSAAGGLVSTIDDYCAFAQMLLDGGRYRGVRVLARPSIELMTTDQLTPAQKAISGLIPGQFDAIGWGFGVAVVTRRDDLAHVGTYGWDGGLGSFWRNDPHEQLITIVMSSRAWDSPGPPAVCRDVWTTAYQAIDD